MYILVLSCIIVLYKLYTSPLCVILCKLKHYNYNVFGDSSLKEYNYRYNIRTESLVLVVPFSRSVVTSVCSTNCPGGLDCGTPLHLQNLFEGFLQARKKKVM